LVLLASHFGDPRAEGIVPAALVVELTHLATLYGDRSTHLRLLAGHQRVRASLEEGSLDPTSDMPSAGAMGGRGAAPLGGGSPSVGAGMTAMGK
jgi:hypothetical protein